MRRYLARQFARPSGFVGERLIAPLLDRTGRAMSRFALTRLDIAPGDRVLEVGFGGGVLTAMLIDRGARVTGIDLSEAMVARATRRFAGAARTRQAVFLVGAAEELPDLGPFDAAVSVNTIYFWPDLGVVLAGFARLVRPSGRLLLCFQTPDAVRRWPGHRHGFMKHDPDAVAAAMTASGFGPITMAHGEDRRVGGFVSLRGQRS